MADTRPLDAGQRRARAACARAHGWQRVLRRGGAERAGGVRAARGAGERPARGRRPLVAHGRGRERADRRRRDPRPGARRSRSAGHRGTRGGSRRGSARRDPARPAVAARRRSRSGSSSLTRSSARRCSTSATSCAAPGFTAAPPTPWPSSARNTTSRRSRCTCSRRRPPRDARQAAEMLVRAGRRALERLAYEDAAERFDRAVRRSSSRTPRTSPVRCCSPAAMRCCARGSPKRREQPSRRPARWRCDAATTALLAEAALGFAGLGIAIVDLDAEAIARLEEALERVEDPALRSRVQARLAVELYYAPDRTRSDAPQRGRGRNRARVRRRERARLRPERAPCGAVAARPRRGAPRQSPAR